MWPSKPCCLSFESICWREEAIQLEIPEYQKQIPIEWKFLITNSGKCNCRGCPLSILEIRENTVPFTTRNLPGSQLKLPPQVDPQTEQSQGSGKAKWLLFRLKESTFDSIKCRCCIKYKKQVYCVNTQRFRFVIWQYLPLARVTSVQQRMADKMIRYDCIWNDLKAINIIIFTIPFL